MSDSVPPPPPAPTQPLAPPPGPYSAAAPAVAALAPGVSPKSFLVTWILSLLLGGLGIDRFYLGKIGTGILKLVTGGGAGVWWLIDLILTLAGAAKDKSGRVVRGSKTEHIIGWSVAGAIVLISIISGSASAASGPRVAADSEPETSASSTLADLESPAAAPAEPAPSSAPAEPAPAAPQAPAETTSQSNAIRAAENYLRFAAFSRSGLIDQLGFEGFSVEDATYAVDSLVIDWSAQAAKSAANYLDFSPFSRAGLIKQLEFEGYSTDEATFGTDSLNADWNAQAAKSAANYLGFTSFSRSGLIDQLVFEGFTPEQAAYGVSTTGL